MKNKVSKIVISMLIASFVVPSVADAKIKGRERSANTGTNRTAANVSGTNNVSAINIATATSGSMIVNKNQNTSALTRQNSEKMKEINTAISKLTGKIEEAKSVCSGISNALNTIYGLDVATTAVSAVGTATAGGALAVGLIKNKKEKDVFNANQQKDSFNNMVSENLAKSEEMEEYNKSVKKYNAELAKSDALYKKLGEKGTLEWHRKLNEEYEKQEKIVEKARQWMLNRKKDLEVAKSEIESNSKMDNKQKLLGDDAISKNLKTAKTLGHARTGLMAASIATSGTSLGTSAAASVNAGKVAEKMKQCNTFVGEIRALSGKVKALIADYQEETGSAFTGNKAGVVAADNIGNACKGFDITGINAIKNSMTASAVISGIGTATAITGTTTSAIANTQKMAGTDKQKKLDLTSNIMAGITTGTSLTTTAVSGAVIGKVKAAIAVAKECESAL